MPCMKCSNGKYKYGEHGKCVYDTLAACRAAEAAIHAKDVVNPCITIEDPCEQCKPAHDKPQQAQA